MPKDILIKISLKEIIVGIVIIGLVVSNVLLLNKIIKIQTVNEDDYIEKYADEISRVKYFIKDWYDELYPSKEHFEVYINELRFDNGIFSLTVANDRIRAVYPRGERYFQLQYITYIDFTERNGHLQCRLYYGKTGEYLFKIN